MLLPLLLFISTLFAAEPVVHRPPVAASLFPQGARPGHSFSAEILGEYLHPATAVLTSTPSISASVLTSSPTRITLKINVLDSAPYGLHTLNVISPRGVSNPVLLRIGDLPHTLESEPNSLPDAPQSVSIPATILGRLPTDGDFDFFRFHAAKNSHWLFDLRSARQGNGLDAALILLDANGRKLAHSEERFIWDPFLSYTFHADGDYLIAVQPTHTRNDPNFAYSLDIRQSPHIDTLAPLALSPGRHEVTLYGAGFHDPSATLEFSNPQITGRLTQANGATARAEIVIPALPDGPQQLTVITKSGRSTPVQFLTDSLPLATGPTLTAPAQFTAMARYRDPHKFTINAQANQQLTFEVRSQRYGADSDLTIRLLDATGKVIASNDDFAFAGAAFYTKDPRLTHKFAAAGAYTLELRNTVAVAGEGTPFQLTVTEAAPRFTPQLGESRVHLFPGKSKKWKLAVQRLDGHTAEIPLELAGLPACVAAPPAAIPASKNEVEIELTAAAECTPGTAAPVTVKLGGQRAWQSVRVSSGGGEGAAFVRLDTAIVAVAAKPNFSLEAATSAVNVPRGGAAKIPFTIRREPGFSTPITFQIDNLPPGVTADSLTVPADRLTAELTIRAAADAPEARSSRVAILGSAGSEQQEAPRISVLTQ